MPVLTFRGRDVLSKDIDVVKELIRTNPGISRRALSFEVCAAWGWTQAQWGPM